MLKTKVKVGQVRNLSDARYCAGMGVDMLGFPVGLDHHNINPEKYKEITGWVSVPDLVIEWNDPELPSGVNSLIQHYNAGFAEFDAGLIDQIPEITPRLIVRLHAPDWPKLETRIHAQRKRIAYIVLTGDGPVDVSLVTRIGGEYPLLLGYGILAENVDSLLRLPIAGIALTGSEETRPGLKHYGQLADVLEALEN